MRVWIAAKIPAAVRPFVTINIGGQTLSIQGEGSKLGDMRMVTLGYDMGTTKVVPGTNKIQLAVNAPQGADLAVDTFLLSRHFRPNGVIPPDPIDFSSLMVKKRG